MHLMHRNGYLSERRCAVGMKRIKIFDMHCDTLYECYETGTHLRKNDLAIDAAKARGLQNYAQFFALFCGARGEESTADAADGKSRRYLLDLPPEKRLDALLTTAQTEFSQNTDWLMPCTDVHAWELAWQTNKTAAFLSIEGAELLTDEAALQRAYDAGVRMVTLAWNYDSPYACGAAADNAKGLSDKGFALLDALIQRKMILDVSHLSEAGFWDVCAHTEVPFAASHSNSRAVCNHLRNLTDAQFSEIVHRGGIVGLNLFTDFIGGHTISDVLLHIEHFCALGGQNCLAVGADWDGCSRLPDGIHTIADIEKLAEAMLQKNYTQSTVDAIFYGNLSAFLRRML